MACPRAIALRRAGFAVDVVEKNPKWDVYGVGMIQPANALRVLHEIGLAEQCVAAGHPMYGDKTWLGDGETFLVGHDWEPLVEGLPPGNGIARPALHRILQDAVLGSGTEVRAGVTLTTLDDDGEQVTVGFTDGDTRAYDLVDRRRRPALAGPRDGLRPGRAAQLHRPGVLALQPAAHRGARPHLGLHRRHRHGRIRARSGRT